MITANLINVERHGKGMDIDGLVDRIQEQEEERRAAAAQIRDEVGSTLFTDGGAVEDAFLHEVDAADLADTSVAGVDGGLARKELHGMDLIMTRAVAAVFSYESGELVEADYRPGTSPTPKVETLTGRLDRGQVDRAASLHRLTAEVEAAQDAAADADIVLMDGSIVPQFPDRPAHGSPLRGTYEDLIERYQDLYGAAMDGDVLLAGVVEDTRGSMVCDLLAANGFDRDVVRQGRDSVLLTDVLEKGERTIVQRYGDPETHPVLQDFRGERDALHSFTLKPVADDRPIRVDILARGDVAEVADRVASTVYALGGIGKTYGIPPVLIEADQRAKIRSQEIGMLTKRLQTRLAHLPGTSDLRRDRRPF